MVRRFRKFEKDEIVAGVRARFAREFPMPRHKACLHVSLLVCMKLYELGTRCILQAGTCMWPRLRLDQDDGIAHTHYSFVWEPNTPQSIRAMLSGNLPEMHVWAAIPEANEIIDLNTGELPIHAREYGMDWPGDSPPDYFWDSKLPDRVVYCPNMQATELAVRLAKGIIDAYRTPQRPQD